MPQETDMFQLWPVGRHVEKQIFKGLITL